MFFLISVGPPYTSKPRAGTYTSASLTRARTCGEREAEKKLERRGAAEMTTLRPFTCDDLFTYNDVNTDVFTETFNLKFYLGYLATWPEYFSTAEGPSGRTAGYVMGKVEGRGENWHGHVTAVTVAPSYRRQGLAKKLMGELESITEKMHDGYFVDLFVRWGEKARVACIWGGGEQRN